MKVPMHAAATWAPSSARCRKSRAALGGRDRNCETLIGTHLAPQTNDADVKSYGCESLGR
jgi:hypothetical protein